MKRPKRSTLRLRQNSRHEIYSRPPPRHLRHLPPHPRLPVARLGKTKPTVDRRLLLLVPQLGVGRDGHERAGLPLASSSSPNGTVTIWPSIRASQRMPYISSIIGSSSGSPRPNSQTTLIQRIRDSSDKQNRSISVVTNHEQEGVICSEHRWFGNRCGPACHNGGGRSGFSALFVDIHEGFVDDCRNE